MAKTFKVGDKVRILDVNKIAGGNSHWSNGDIAEVLGVREYDGGLRLTRVKTGTYNGFGPVVIRGEFAGIELVDATPTKKQRIKALENEVEALKYRIEALENGAIKNDETGRNYIANKMAEALKRHLESEQQTPNQRRKAVIERAKTFVADMEKKALGGLGKVLIFTTKPEYHVNKEKRVVTVLIKGAINPKLYGKAIARCALGDVFNEHIGKAIALAKAYGLEIPKEFTDAPQPEIAVGQRIEDCVGGIDVLKDEMDRLPYSTLISGGTVRGRAFHTKETSGWIAESQITQILDDTEAQYE